MKRFLCACVALVGCGRTSDSDCPDYAAISGGTFARAGAQTTWTMDVVAIPPTLTFDEAEVPDSVLEYRWAIDLDADSDGTDDLELAIQHFRMPGVAEHQTADLLSATQQDLWTLNGAGGSISGDITATVADSTLTFVVADSEDAKLPMVTMALQGTWKTAIHTADGQCTDSFQP